MMVNEIDKKILKIWGESKYPKNTTLDFCSSDGLKPYNKNKKRFPEHMNKFKDLNYCFNEFGFRSDSFSEKCTLLFNGCSHTMGIGLQKEKTYGYIISQYLGIPYHNISQAASDISLSVARTVYWLPKLKPNVLIFQIPNNRIGYFVNKKQKFTSSARSEWKNGDLIWEPNLLWNHYSSIKTLENLCEEYNVKLYHVRIDDERLAHLRDDVNNLARDLIHYGIEPNQILADLHIDNIKNLL